MKKLIPLFSLLFLATACTPDSKQFEAAMDANLTIDQSSAAEKLAGAVRYPTTWSQDAKANRPAFIAFHNYLERSFPLVHQNLRLEKINQLSLVYIWQGSDPSLKPVIFLSHQDVVPVDHPEKWQVAPFAGVIDDTFIHGRGTIDVKFGITGTLDAAEHLLKIGFKPKRTIIFAYGHDEEIMGTRGGEKIAQWMAEQGIKAEYILDEGPAVIPGLVPNLDKPVAFVGLAARGNAYFSLSADVEDGGHASIPPKETPISIIAGAITKATAHKFETELTEPLVQMLEYLSPEMPWLEQIVYQNHAVFSPFILNEYGKFDTGRAVIQNTLAPTIFKGGDKDATLPNHAKAVIAMGILPGQTIETARVDLANIINDDRVKIDIVRFPDNQRPHAYDPTPIAPTDHWAFRSLQKSIHQIFPKAVVAPTLMPGGSDGKHYAKAGVTEKVYHFFPIDVTNEQIERMHGIDEKLPITSYINSIRFYAQLMMNIQSE